MAAQFFYDAMLPVPKRELPKTLERGERQLEVFTYDGKVHVCLGSIGEENSGRDRYTVVLPLDEARKLLDGVDRAVSYVGGER